MLQPYKKEGQQKVESLSPISFMLNAAAAAAVALNFLPLH